MLEMFNILENYDLVSMGFNTPEYLFTFNEALRLQHGGWHHLLRGPGFL